MVVQRKRFRIEEVVFGSAPPIDQPDTEIIPMHDEIMTELRAIREQMGRAPHEQPSAGAPAAALSQQEADTHALLQTYRAQIEQCEKLKIELDLIHNAITRTKQEIAVLHGKSFNGAEMAKVTGELGAVVGGTEEATQHILEAAEAIDNAASAMAKVTSPDQHRLLSEEIQERVVAIFEACNFQDLTGQRITKVVKTLHFIEDRVNRMMGIWGGLEAFNDVTPDAQPVKDEHEALLNGPALPDDESRVSQDDIDALFD